MHFSSRIFTKHKLISIEMPIEILTSNLLCSWFTSSRINSKLIMTSRKNNFNNNSTKTVFDQGVKDNDWVKQVHLDSISEVAQRLRSIYFCSLYIIKVQQTQNFRNPIINKILSFLKVNLVPKICFIQKVIGV